MMSRQVNALLQIIFLILGSSRLISTIYSFLENCNDHFWIYKLQTKARLIKQYGNIFSYISDGTAFLLQGVTKNFCFVTVVFAKIYVLLLNIYVE